MLHYFWHTDQFSCLSSVVLRWKHKVRGQYQRTATANKGERIKTVIVPSGAGFFICPYKDRVRERERQREMKEKRECVCVPRQKKKKLEKLKE